MSITEVLSALGNGEDFTIKQRSFLMICLLTLYSFFLLENEIADPNDSVNIPDANLRSVIENYLGKTSGETITEAEMVRLRSQGIGLMPLAVDLL